MTLISREKLSAVAPNPHPLRRSKKIRTYCHRSPVVDGAKKGLPVGPVSPVRDAFAVCRVGRRCRRPADGASATGAYDVVDSITDRVQFVGRRPKKSLA